MEIKAIVSNSARKLHPAYFAMVMATGIISIGIRHEISNSVAYWLLLFNMTSFGLLTLLTIVRVVTNTKCFIADLLVSSKSFSFFTMPAALSILGEEVLLIGRQPMAALVLWLIAIVVFVCLMYTIFVAMFIRTAKPAPPKFIDGTWLLAPVAAQSLSVLGSILASDYPATSTAILLFVALALWLCGCVLYLWLGALLLFRDLLLRVDPEDITPGYWIAMGAAAISSLAGGVLSAHFSQSKVLIGMLPFLKGLTVLFWTAATWWVPVLIVLEIWKHAYNKLPVQYDPSYWGLVFPLGMYAVSTTDLADVLQLPFLQCISSVFICCAVAAWLATFLGFLQTMWVRLSMGGSYG